MKLAIFGYPRSGTTMLMDIVGNHLISAGAIGSDNNLDEVFNPVDGRKLISANNHVRNVVHYGVMSRKDRFDLFTQSSDQDYLIKVLSADVEYRPVLPWLVANYPIITIERRDHLEAFLSWVIAWYSKKWNVGLDAPNPVIEPFIADMNAVTSAGIIFSRYFQAKPIISAQAHIYYEDMVAMSPREVLEHVGIYHPCATTTNTRFRKLTSMEEKVKLIINLDEVISYYHSSVATIASIEW
jgi:hypothetical protein